MLDTTKSLIWIRRRTQPGSAEGGALTIENIQSFENMENSPIKFFATKCTIRLRRTRILMGVGPYFVQFVQYAKSNN